MLLKTLASAVAAAGAAAAYWMEEIPHQGLSPYHQDASAYQVFRNVRDFGAVGDGVTDDTAAINEAISFGVRCAPQVCNQSTTAPATVYFPPGTYLISASIIDFYYTMLIGDPTDLPVIKASADFNLEANLGLIDGNPYGPGGGLAWGATNVFFRQIANLILDTTSIPADKAGLGIHWPSSQATSITNCEFRLAEGPSSQHRGLFIEEGSGGLLNDLRFYGGKYGADLGNQQYTARNLHFFNAQVAIHQLWDWGWTYKSIHVENCGIGIQMESNATASITLLDSHFSNVGTAITTIRDPGVTVPPAAGSLVMYNVVFTQVETVLLGPNGVVIPGGTQVLEYSHAGFAMGHVYDPFGPEDYTGSSPSLFPKPPAALLDREGDKYYERSKPRYEDMPIEKFISARDCGCVGDGVTDDTKALNDFFLYATENELIAFVDAGAYYVTDTVHIPPGARIVGEALASNIIGGGPLFGDITKPHPVVKVGNPGDEGCIEWSDMILATRGAAPGAKILEYNLNAPPGIKVSGMWDVHIRVGGFAGTEHQLAQCPKTPDQSGIILEECIASWMSMHITKSASGLLMENCWVWVADHDLEDPEYRQITIYAGRGVLVEAEHGRLWFSASSSEHHVLYQYLLHDTRDVYMGMIQTETPYFQPNPPATVPFPPLPAYHDPDFAADCAHASPDAVAPCAMAWGLRITNCENVIVYGAGLYSFFNNYSTDCCQIGAGARCQQRIFDIRDTRGGKGNSTGVEVYNLEVVGTRAMITRFGEDIASYDDNIAGFTAGIAVFKLDE